MSKRQAQRKRKRYRDDDYTSEPDSTASEPEEDSDKPLPGTSRSTAPEDRRFGAACAYSTPGLFFVCH